MVREFVYVFAAVCAKLGRLTALILPRANTEMMNLFLEQLAQNFQGYFIILSISCVRASRGWPLMNSGCAPWSIFPICGLILHELQLSITS